MTADTGLELGARLRKLRDDAGLSLVDLMFAVRSTLPRRCWVGDETLRRYENGTVLEDRADLVLIAALCSIYRCSVTDISPSLSDDIRIVRDLMKKAP